MVTVAMPICSTPPPSWQRFGGSQFQDASIADIRQLLELRWFGTEYGYSEVDCGRFPLLMCSPSPTCPSRPIAQLLFHVSTMALGSKPPSDDSMKEEPGTGGMI